MPVWRVAVLLAIVLALSAETVGIHLRDMVELAKPTATVADVAELSGDARLIAKLSPLAVQELSGVGTHRLDAATVRMALGRLVPAGEVVISGTCQLSRRSLSISEDELVAAVIAQARSVGDDEVEVRKVRGSGALLVPADEAPPRLLAEVLDRSPSGEIPYRVRVLQGENELARTLVVVQVSRYRRMTVAARALRRGEALGAGDLRTERLPVTARLAEVTDASTLLGRSARQDIPEGMPLAAALFTVVPEVQSGQTVTISCVSERVRLSASGSAMADGRVGEVIQVRRGDGKAVKARVISSGQVQIDP
jgi:flagella basal body P-ring formation protein FlgA